MLAGLQLLPWPLQTAKQHLCMWCMAVSCREAVKMALLLPTVPVRLCMCFAAIIGVAIVNSLAILGW